MNKINEKIMAWLDPATIEPKALEQLHNISEMPFIFKHIAVMPDCHWGKGATVGSVIATKGAIIPAAVGVDIGCFSGDTKIPLVDGKAHSLKELALRRDEFAVYSCTPEGKIVAAKARALLTRRNAS